jgi:hypothetical protein
MQRPTCLHRDVRVRAGGGCLFEGRAELGLERAALDVAQQVFEVQLVPRDVLHLRRNAQQSFHVWRNRTHQTRKEKAAQKTTRSREAPAAACREDQQRREVEVVAFLAELAVLHALYIYVVAHIYIYRLSHSLLNSRSCPQPPLQRAAAAALGGPRGQPIHAAWHAGKPPLAVGAAQRSRTFRKAANFALALRCDCSASSAHENALLYGTCAAPAEGAGAGQHACRRGEPKWAGWAQSW